MGEEEFIIQHDEAVAHLGFCPSCDRTYELECTDPVMADVTVHLLYGSIVEHLLIPAYEGR